jgi:hypothetical protein
MSLLNARANSRWIRARVRYLPIVLAMIWLWGTLGLFAFGPYGYPVINKIQLYSYLVAAHLTLFLGYCTGAASVSAGYAGKWRPLQILRFSLWLNLIFLLLKLLLTRGDVLDFRTALQDPFLAYELFIQSQGTSLWPYVEMILEPFNAPFLMLAAYYWQSERPFVRCFFIFFLSAAIFSAVRISVRGSIIYQIITVGGAFLAAYHGGQLKLKILTKAVVAGLLVIGSVSLFFYLTFIVSLRYSAASPTFNPMIGQFPDPDHPIVQMVPESKQALVMSAITYVTHGYYGLSIALEKPFVGICFGVGNSSFLMRNFVRMTGFSNLYDRSYDFRLITEDNYPVGRYWITIYPWIASDTTFIGSLIVMFIIGRLFAQSWLDAVRANNPAALIAFGLLAHLIYAFPMNNPLQDGGAITRTYFWLILWWIMRRRLPEGTQIGQPYDLRGNAELIHTSDDNPL